MIIQKFKKDRRYKFLTNQIVVLNPKSEKVRPLSKCNYSTLIVGVVLPENLSPKYMKIKNNEIAILREYNIGEKIG